MLPHEPRTGIVYQPGEYVTVTGTGWIPGEIVNLLFHQRLDEPSCEDTTLLAIADGEVVTIEWDTTKGGKHALDYLTTYNRTVDSNPCEGVAGCNPGASGVSSIANKTLCTPVTKDIDTLGKLMGGFWSDVSRTSTGGKRSATDQARMQLLQQLLAAELNASAFGSVPSSGTFAQWEAAYCSGNANQIKTAQQQAASFNSAGDSGQFTPGTSADSKNARTIANTAFWNVLP